jgi:hypothetical protein
MADLLTVPTYALVQTRTDTQVDSAGHGLYKSIVALPVGKPPLTRAFGPVEVKGLEPSASALRKCGSQCFDQALSEDFPGSGILIPSGSLTIPLLPSR